MALERPSLPVALDRRTVIRGGLAGAGLLALPGAALAAASGFSHGVASGEPGPDRVLLWTRFVGAAAPLRYEVADSLDFSKVVAGGDARALEDRDWCAKVVATGLQPGRWYYYRFVGPAGEISPVGRTRTLPVGQVDRFRLAVFSCSNLGFGWFNAYRHAAEDGAFDLAVHLGDYYYEYEKGEYPSTRQVIPGRVLLPGHETVKLADYRLRHAAYRADPDLQRLFQLQPWIMVWDDHESANDSWRGGAQNHQPGTEGPWNVRTAAALRAYREWLPVSDEPWAAYDIGDLATLFRLETRLTARDKPFDFGDILAGKSAGELDAALTAFRDGAWRDPSRTLLGARQEAWLAAGLQASRRGQKTWQVLAQQVLVGELKMPRNLTDAMPGDLAEGIRSRIVNGVRTSRLDLPYNMDGWDGYPAARARLLDAAQAADANLVVLTGDTHNAWASNLTNAGRAAGIELGGHSVTSPGAERSLHWIPPERLARDLIGVNPGLAWCDTARRGYMAVELTPARASSEYRFLATVKARSTRLAGTHAMTVEAGRKRFA